MSLFRDIEAYWACANLFAEYWQSIPQGRQALKPFADEFLEKIEEVNSTCTPEDADRWCAALEREPFQGYENNSVIKYHDLYAKFTERIMGADGRYAVSRWLRFAANRRCLGDRDIASLLELAPTPDEGDIWVLPVYRQAFWGCRLGSDDVGQLVAEYLRQLLEHIRQDSEQFNEWVEIVREAEIHRVPVFNEYEESQQPTGTRHSNTEHSTKEQPRLHQLVDRVRRGFKE